MSAAPGTTPVMGSPGREHPATEALRHGSVAELASALAVDLARHSGVDQRDAMIHLTPYHDAAGRLGTTPATVFDEAAAAVDGSIADLARRFGRRTDLTLAVMGWRLEETPDGPAYRFAWPRWTPPRVDGPGARSGGPAASAPDREGS
jgi:hypothetical protein